VIDHGMDLRMAVEKPKVHHQWLPDGIRVEPHGTPTDVLDGLRARGHNIIARPTFGIACAIQYDQEGGVLMGVPDNRGIGEAVGV
jgi:gamma-glutamyltranspeptidase / glutathione hydrolase